MTDNDNLVFPPDRPDWLEQTRTELAKLGPSDIELTLTLGAETLAMEVGRVDLARRRAQRDQTLALVALWADADTEFDEGWLTRLAAVMLLDYGEQKGTAIRCPDCGKVERSIFVHPSLTGSEDVAKCFDCAVTHGATLAAVEPGPATLEIEAVPAEPATSQPAGPQRRVPRRPNRSRGES